MTEPGDKASIRHATGEDAAALSALHGSCFARTWSENEFSRLLDSPGVFGLLIPGTAMILLRVVLDEAEILTICTAPVARGQGHAGRLLKQAMQMLQDMGGSQLFLEVAADNTAALALYRRHGFAETGRRPGYYQPADIDALTMACALPMQGAR